MSQAGSILVIEVSRRGILGMLAVGVGAAIVRTPGLLMPIKPVLVRPILTIHEYAYTGISPAMKAMMLAMEEAMMFGQSTFMRMASGECVYVARKEFRGLVGAA